MKIRGLILATSVVCLALMWNQYSGDALIYLCFAKNLANGNGLVFNVGEFSSGATSPIWPVILSPCFILPWPEIMAKFVSLAFLLSGLHIGYKHLPEHEAGDIGLAIVFYFAIVPTLLAFETGLLVWVLFSMVSGKRWTYGVLPFVRPEGIVISLAAIVYRRDWLQFVGLIPILTFWTASWILTGYFSTSVVFRSQMVNHDWLISLYLLKRYVVILLPFVVYGASKWRAQS